MDRKAEYVEKLSVQLVEWDRQLDILTYKADNADAEAKAGYCQEMDSLLRQRQAVELQLQKVAAASDATWQEMKEAGDDSWEEIRTDLHDAIVNIK